MIQYYYNIRYYIIIKIKHLLLLNYYIKKVEIGIIVVNTLGLLFVYKNC